MTIRNFQPDDQNEVRSLILEGLGEHFGRIDPTLNPDLDNIEASYIQAGHLFVVVESAGQIIGTGALVSEEAETGRIVRVSVAPAYRQAGLGQQLVEYLLQAARQRGFSRVLVETNLDWYAAIRLYRRCGFREYARDEESVHLSFILRIS
jgi:ribosomal protein S18 acetylase RimI-like enzyme